MRARRRGTWVVVFVVSLVTLLGFLGCRGSVDRVYDDALLGQDAGPPDTSVITPAIDSGSGTPDTGAKKPEAGADATVLVEAGPTTPSKISGTVIGLIGTGLILQNNGKDDLPVTVGGAFQFTTAVPPGAPYDVTVLAQPTGPTQTCTVEKGKGTTNGVDIIDVVIRCVNEAYTIGGSVVGLAGTGLVLQNNGANDTPVTVSGPFTFTTKVPSGANFNVTVKTNPTGPVQTCNVSGGQGTVGSANVDSVVINCGTNTYTIGGTVTGLSGRVVLRNNGGDERTISSNGSFAFSTPIASGARYDVTVQTQPGYPPTAQTCTVTNDEGTVGSANVTNVQVSCVTRNFSVGGNVTGVQGTGLVLKLNGGSDKAISAAGPFSFPNIPSGSAYTVTVASSPASQTCIVVNGAGNVRGANVTNIGVSCHPVIAFQENFDGVTEPALPAGWTATDVVGASADNWRTTSSRAEALLSLHVNTEAYTSDFIVDSPPINIATSTASVSFWNQFDTELNYDGCALEISIAGAPFADILAAGGSFVSGGYTGKLTTSDAALNGRDVFMGDSCLVPGNTACVINTVANLPAAAQNKSIVLRFRCATDGGEGDPGWYVDSLVVRN